MKKLVALILPLLVISTSCKNTSRKNKPVSIDSMKVWIWDMMKADELYIRMLAKDSTAKQRKENIRLYEEVFAIHGINKSIFDSNFHYYEAHPLLFKVLVDSLEAYASREKIKLYQYQDKAR
ncbi:MAG: hypothetical protein RLZZ28_1802 [Bacteroidota bacterium]|jgi:hypothetical protein